MATATRGSTGRKRPRRNLKKLNNSPTVSRFMSVNHLNHTVDRLSATETRPLLQAFLPKNLFPWITSYLKNAFTPRVKFPVYTSAQKTGVYAIAPSAGTAVRIAIAGDWGTGTREAEIITNLMADTNPDLTIHLGDVYYVGDDAEINENCLGQRSEEFDGVVWRHGVQGSFALNGNHEMYANGGPYFNIFLKSLGMKSDPDQVASFFCLEAGAWRIVAIDTGYNSVGIPILSMIPGINQIPFIGGDCHLEKKFLEWLQNVVKVKENVKPTLILSHHQYYSAFPDRAYTKPAKQLKKVFEDQAVVWMWGHEHRLGIYDKASKDGGINAFGRCLGHGGMPVEVADFDVNKAPLQFFDKRSEPLDGDRTGKNGFAIATIDGDVLTLEYRDIDNLLVFREEFRPEGNGKSLHYTVLDRGILQPASPV